MSFLPVGGAAQRPPSPRRLRPSSYQPHPRRFPKPHAAVPRHGAHITHGTSLCTRQPAALPPQQPLSAFILRYQNYCLSSTCKRDLPTPIETPPAVRVGIVLDPHSFHSLLSNTLAPPPTFSGRCRPLYQFHTAAIPCIWFSKNIANEGLGYARPLQRVENVFSPRCVRLFGTKNVPKSR